MFTLRVKAALLLAAACLSSPLAGQEGGGPEQTRETALVFFSTLARNGSISLQQRAQGWNFPNAPVADFVAFGNDGCSLAAVLGPFEFKAFARKAYRSGGGDMFLDIRSDLGFMPLFDLGPERNRVYYNGSGTSRDFGYYQNEYTISGYERAKLMLDFVRTSRVSRYGNVVTVTTQSGSPQFALPTEDLAKRMEFALEFMRLECDPTGDLAF